MNVSASSVASDGVPPTDTREPGFMRSTSRITRTSASSGATSRRVTTRFARTMTSSAAAKIPSSRRATGSVSEPGDRMSTAIADATASTTALAAKIRQKRRR